MIAVGRCLILEALGALGEPDVLGQAVYQNEFGGCRGLVFFAESVTEFTEELSGYVGNGAEEADQTAP